MSCMKSRYVKCFYKIIKMGLLRKFKEPMNYFSENELILQLEIKL